MNVAFWVCFGLLLVVYLGYPAAMALLSLRHGSSPIASMAVKPSVSIVIAARNEATTLPAKLASIVAQTYPADLLSVVVASDGSTDDTVTIARSIGEERVEVISLPERRGKAMALNAAMQEAMGEIVVFTDARQPLDSEAVERLVAHFSDPAMGAVSGDLEYPGRTREGWTSALRGYWSYERRIRRGEAALDSCVGVTGALYAIRRDLWRPLPPGLILDDVFTPMQIVMAGYRVGFEPQAVAFETFSEHEEAEFARRVRTLTGNYQLLRELPGILLPWRNPIWLQYALHKTGRLASPFLLIAALVTSGAADGYFYEAAFGLQIVAWLVGLASVAIPDRLLESPALGVVRALTLGQVSLIVAFGKFVTGDLNVWVERTKQQRP